MSKTRVLVVDDSPLIRRILCDILSAEADIEVVGQARNGEEGVRLAAELRPDVVTMDVEMPTMTGLQALKAMMAQRPVPVIMCSSLTAAGTSETIQALEAGAFDFLCKPDNGSFLAIRSLRGDLLEKIRAAQHVRLRPTAAPAVVKAALPLRTTDRVVLIASSTGGPRALTVLFESLPKGLSCPILIVQHIPAGFVESLAKRLERVGAMPVAEAKRGDKVVPGRALLAPSGLHMKVGTSGELTFSEEPHLHGVRPAADYLFHSAAKAYGPRCLCVVLTGMGRDGAEGALAIKKAGGTVLSESESTCTVYGMPRAAVALGAVEAEIPIERMGSAIVSALNGRLANAS